MSMVAEITFSWRELVEVLKEMINPESETLYKVLMTLAIVLLGAGIQLIVGLIARRISDVKRRYLFRRALNYLSSAALLCLILLLWFHAILPSIGTFLGLTSAGLAVAMHDTIASVAGWCFITFCRPFQVGDRIEIDGIVGDVIDVRILQFSVIEVGGPRVSNAEQSTGRVIHIPNSKTLRFPLVNYRFGFSHIWDEIAILVTFESDWEEARKLLLEIIGRHAEKFTTRAKNELRRAAERLMIYDAILTPTVYTAIQESGVQLSIRFVVNPTQKRTVRQAVSEEILRAFAERDDIDLAYPTTRFYQRGEGPPTAAGEGHPGATHRS
mgnify:FL=1